MPLLHKFIVFSLFLIVSACSSVDLDRMIPNDLDVYPYTLSDSLSIVVSGGREAVGFESVIGKEFKEVLTNTFQQNGMFRIVGKEASNLILEVEIKSQNQVNIGLDYTGTMKVAYTIKDKSTSAVLWVDIINSKQLVTVLDSFSGATRTSRAREGAVRENITTFIGNFNAKTAATNGHAYFLKLFLENDPGLDKDALILLAGDNEHQESIDLLLAFGADGRKATSALGKPITGLPVLESRVIDSLKVSRTCGSKITITGPLGGETSSVQMMLNRLHRPNLPDSTSNAAGVMKFLSTYASFPVSSFLKNNYIWSVRPDATSSKIVLSSSLIRESIQNISEVSSLKKLVEADKAVVFQVEEVDGVFAYTLGGLDKFTIQNPELIMLEPIVSYTPSQSRLSVGYLIYNISDNNHNYLGLSTNENSKFGLSSKVYFDFTSGANLNLLRVTPSKDKLLFKRTKVSRNPDANVEPILYTYFDIVPIVNSYIASHAHGISSYFTYVSPSVEYNNVFSLSENMCIEGTLIAESKWQKIGDGVFIRNGGLTFSGAEIIIEAGTELGIYPYQ